MFASGRLAPGAASASVPSMRVGLTGGIGAGKSTVARLLAERGAVVIDADAIAREVLEPGTAGLAEVVTRFGEAILAPDGSLDRPALAAAVFADPGARAELNAIVHPLVGARSAELMAAAAPDAIVVYDVPLLVESELSEGFDAVVVVEADPTTRVHRLAGRGMTGQDARARMDAQASDDQRRAVAHEVLANDATPAVLAAEVDQLWARLTARRDALAGGS